MKTVAAAILALASCAALAADEPEAVYAKFHRASLQADIATMLRLCTPSMQARMKLDGRLEEQAPKLAAIMPPVYSVKGRAAGSTRVVLQLDGTGGLLATTSSGKPGKQAGKVTLLLQDGQWKIDQLEWLVVAEPLPQFPASPVGPDPGAPRVIAAPPGRAVAAPRKAE